MASYSRCPRLPAACIHLSVQLRHHSSLQLWRRSSPALGSKSHPASSTPPPIRCIRWNLARHVQVILYWLIAVSLHHSLSVALGKPLANSKPVQRGSNAWLVGVDRLEGCLELHLHFLRQQPASPKNWKRSKLAESATQALAQTHTTYGKSKIRAIRVI